MKMLIALALFGLAAAVPVDNGVEGDPEIECGPTSITVNFNTRNNFEGHVYVKGLYDQEDAGCRNTERGRQVAGIELDFSTCNVRRFRSLNPKGVFVQTSIIISFHPLFVTKVDRAYTIQCFYMDADKTVDTRLEVSMLTTEFKTQVVPMPVCRYEILDSGPTGAPVEFAVVGQPIYHKWTCDSETIDTFCMIVHSCFVDDTNGDQVQLIREDGCAEDLYLLNNPEYPADLMAGVEAHVFKYADRADLYFQCQITILVKEPNDECPRPACGAPAGRGAGSANPQEGPIQQLSSHNWPLEGGSPYLPQGTGGYVPPGGVGAIRGKRAVDMTAAAGTLDVGSHIAALDIDDRVSALPSNIAHRSLAYQPASVYYTDSEAMCLSSGALTAIGVIGFGLLLAVIASSAFLLLRRK
jgi:hypothetical protein